MSGIIFYISSNVKNTETPKSDQVELNIYWKWFFILVDCISLTKSKILGYIKILGLVISTVEVILDYETLSTSRANEDIIGVRNMRMKIN